VVCWSTHVLALAVAVAALDFAKPWVRALGLCDDSCPGQHCLQRLQPGVDVSRSLISSSVACRTPLLISDVPLLWRPHNGYPAHLAVSCWLSAHQVAHVVHVHRGRLAVSEQLDQGAKSCRATVSASIVTWDDGSDSGALSLNCCWCGRWMRVSRALRGLQGGEGQRSAVGVERLAQQ
jgi:hypothetical protein